MWLTFTNVRIVVKHLFDNFATHFYIVKLYFNIFAMFPAIVSWRGGGFFSSEKWSRDRQEREREKKLVTRGVFVASFYYRLDGNIAGRSLSGGCFSIPRDPAKSRNFKSRTAERVRYKRGSLLPTAIAREFVWRQSRQPAAIGRSARGRGACERGRASRAAFR